MVLTVDRVEAVGGEKSTQSLVTTLPPSITNRLHITVATKFGVQPVEGMYLTEKWRQGHCGKDIKVYPLILGKGEEEQKEITVRVKLRGLIS